MLLLLIFEQVRLCRSVVAILIAEQVVGEDLPTIGIADARSHRAAASVRHSVMPTSQSRLRRWNRGTFDTCIRVIHLWLQLVVLAPLF